MSMLICSSRSAPEPQILDYITQQFKLFPLLATSYAYTFAGKYIADVYREVNSNIQRGDAEMLPEVTMTTGFISDIDDSS